MSEKMLKVKVIAPTRPGYQHFGSCGKMWASGLSEAVLPESTVIAMQAEVKRGESLLIIEVLGPVEPPKEAPKK